MEYPEERWERFVLAPRSAANRYGVALLLSVGSTAIAAALQLLEPGGYASVALASVVLSAIYGGRGPALVDALLTAVGIDYFLTEPRYVVFDTWESVVHIVVNAGVGLLIAELVTRLHNAYRAARALHAEAMQAARAREQVLAVVSHDLRGPLATISMASAVVKQQLAGNGSTSAAERIERASRQMARQIEDLLDAARIEQGNFRLKLAPADLAGVLDDAIAGVTPAAQARSQRIEREVRGDAALTCDAGRIAQVFANLLHNAVKFSAPGGAVRVLLEGTPGGVEFSVRDSGPGIREEDLGRLFERHWQASDSAHLGTGLGLFICRSIVAAHGGDISAQSSAEGATFLVRLPREGAGAA